MQTLLQPCTAVRLAGNPGLSHTHTHRNVACCNLLSACATLVDELRRRSRAVGIVSTKGKKLIIFFFFCLTHLSPSLYLSLYPLCHTVGLFFVRFQCFFPAAAVAVFVTCPTAPLGYYPWCGPSSTVRCSHWQRFLLLLLLLLPPCSIRFAVH